MTVSGIQAAAAARSDVGKSRSTNEDFFAIRPESNLYLVADGMGGHGNGEVASRLATLSVCETVEAHSQGSWLRKEDPAEQEALVREALEKANDAVFRAVEKDASLSGMGATMVAMRLAGAAAIIAHAGDSRAYRLRNGKLELLTQDHTWVEQQVSAGELSSDEARVHPFRNVVTRALGGEAKLVVEVVSHPVQSGDLFLLCTDGLTGVLGDDEIAEILDRDQTLDGLCGDLIDAANSEGGPDNVTVVVVRLSETDEDA